MFFFPPLATVSIVLQIHQSGYCELSFSSHYLKAFNLTRGFFEMLKVPQISSTAFDLLTPHLALPSVIFTAITG